MTLLFVLARGPSTAWFSNTIIMCNIERSNIEGFAISHNPTALLDPEFLPGISREGGGGCSSNAPIEENKPPGSTHFEKKVIIRPPYETLKKTKQRKTN